MHRASSAGYHKWCYVEMAYSVGTVRCGNENMRAAEAWGEICGVAGFRMFCFFDFTLTTWD